ncbi:ABC-2 type transport system ATP-binding protein [Clostridium acetobutylicum]|uniref:ABC transporter, ATP-binding protein n=1 Tax=Clostridium acetobutylicum (strain ATCC 824 / DSM 792 / JCM 1419 / IAM 19013 / LMG 5710 / NBRC 13948 / NRRL B-527 / VKM B-1787 / 2291 / W) TaxID=272562 RepID=Q97MP5_CLOAB|nr:MULTISPECIES: ABC transporter ATP-binding protein [Clostridium]AAK78131.1 ABC transporter, ATP-binding protein [Clostridium acetobutylicum ATCC 824]ADZ19190.1 ABC transporter, ATP-binding protein [Clostridium acetobutylicum EA 2018]AEI34626.1 ABC transporter, ATP-binding protein [Clostridium acetobutylicum DSM 1731]AWV81807.1 ABC transporter ATP-binding protein [Clostridium acetobutylicum]MBC2395353.1 ABC transporter ATP-binding protein [Clostridium acetobutylicum]
MSNVLEVTDLYKKLGNKEIIKGISFSIKEGEILGFLGRNGAGKTTTIKMLVGLITPDKGSVMISGHDITKEAEEALSCVGAVVENPELYSYLTGRQNLEQVARFYKDITKEDIEKIGNTVGLSGRLDEKVKKYSLGMKQRLGLAEALISKPKLLILDEPTNGLDPTGIIEFRNLLKKQAKENKMAIFVSSHILSEIEQLCDRVAFIDGGIIKSFETLKGTNKDHKTESFENVVIMTKEKDKCTEALKEISFIIDFKLADESNGIYTFEAKAKLDSVPDITSSLAEKKIRIEQIYKRQQNLEDRYIELVNGGKNDVESH